MLASKILPLREFRYANQTSIHFVLSDKEASRGKLEELRDILLDYQGPCKAFLHLTDQMQRETALQMSEQFSVRPCTELVDRVERLFGHEVVQVQ